MNNTVTNFATIERELDLYWYWSSHPTPQITPSINTSTMIHGSRLYTGQGCPNSLLLITRNGLHISQFAMGWIPFLFILLRKTSGIGLAFRWSGVGNLANGRRNLRLLLSERRLCTAMTMIMFILTYLSQINGHNDMSRIVCTICPIQ